MNTKGANSSGGANGGTSIYPFKFECTRGSYCLDVDFFSAKIQKTIWADRERLQKNDQIEIVIQINYNAYSFGGKNTLVLSTTTWIGGRNNFLGLASLALGGICLLIAISFILVYMVRPRHFGTETHSGHQNY